MFSLRLVFAHLSSEPKRLTNRGKLESKTPEWVFTSIYVLTFTVFYVCDFLYFLFLVKTICS